MENSIYNKKSRFSDNLLNFFIQFSTLISIVLLVVIIGYICYRGIPHFSFDYLINTTSILKKTVGILPNIINTLYMIVVTLLIAGPISIGGAIYLNEYATNKKLVHIILWWCFEFKLFNFNRSFHFSHYDSTNCFS